MNTGKPAHMEDLSPWDDAIARTYDTPGEGMFAPEVLTPTVAMLKKLAGGGRALEMGIGTGRVAVPLRQSEVPVAGIEYSPAMLAVLREKATEKEIPVTLGDMSVVSAGQGYALVYLVYNTLSNLQTQDAQVDCFMNAARHLAPGGRFVVEMWVPELRKLPPGQEAVVWDIRDGSIGLDTVDTLNQLVVSHHVSYDAQGNGTVTRSRHRYIWPAEMDLMARLAGFVLEARYGDWMGRPYAADDRSQISVYRKE